MEDTTGYDLVRLEDTSIDSIARLLEYKLVELQQPFTRIYGSTLVLVNPIGNLNLNHVYSKELQNYYAEQVYRSVNVDGVIDLLPHLYETISLAYFHCRRLGEDQSILFSGAVGSGKTTGLFESLQQLQVLAHNPKKPNTKISEQLPALQTVITSLSHSLSLQQHQSSHQGLYMESQFNDRGRMVGIKTLLFHLEKNRLISPTTSNFNIFYQLLHSNEFPSFQLQASQFKILPDTSSGQRESYNQLVDSLKLLGIKNKARTKIFQVLAAILHLSNFEFQMREGDELASVVDVVGLESVATLLGVEPNQLEISLARRSQLVGKEMCTQFLDAKDTENQRDLLMTQLYSLLVTWIMEAINSKLCHEEPSNFIALVDGPGIQNSDGDFERLASNFIAESIQGYITSSLLEPSLGFRHIMIQDGIQLPDIPTPNYPSLYKIINEQNGIVNTIHQLCRQNERNRNDSQLITRLSHQFNDQEMFEFDPTDGGRHFILKHYSGKVRYQVDGFVQRNLDGIPPEFVNLFRKSNEGFIQELFSSDVVQVQSHPDNQRTLVSAQAPTGLLRQPSRKQPRKISSDIPTRLSQLSQVMDDILATIKSTRLWSILTINPCLGSNMLQSITEQVDQLSLSQLSGGLGMEFSHHFDLDQFCMRYKDLIVARQCQLGSEVDQIEALANQLNWRPGQDYVLGETMVFISLPCFKHVEDGLRHELKLIKELGNNNNDDHPIGFIDDNDSVYSGYNNSKSIPLKGYGHYGEVEENEPIVAPIEEKEDVELMRLKDSKGKNTKETVQVMKLTTGRKYWMRITWMMTWWIPTRCIGYCGMSRPDVQMAWREKVTICLLILWSWIIILFVNIGLGLILCPAVKVWKPKEINTLQGPTDLGVYMYGVVYDITSFSQQRHGKSINPAGVDPDIMAQFGGMDVTTSFPIPLTTSCAGLVQDANFKLWTNISDDTLSSSIFVHDSGPGTQYPATTLKDPNWFFSSALPQLKNMKKGEVVYDFSDLSAYRKAGYKQWGAINNRVYDLTAYVQTQQEPQFQVSVPGAPSANFLPNTVYQIFNTQSPAKDADLTELWNTRTGLSVSEKAQVMKCLDRAFFIGTVDQRGSLRCQVTNIMLLVSSGMILLVTLVKFLAALQLTSRRQPVDYDKFVICQVPCYTEGEDSIRRTLESLALLNYDDKHKLIFVIADGMIIGSGNDRPTPKIVLDVLGVDPELDPEPFMFQSIGEGSKQLNYGKIYSGLFQVEGRAVPYIVAIKVGKPGEPGRPGNRGKRDSQILLMNFLNRVHFDSPMSPLDLEIYHQLKNVIGVDPKLYEYILMVDADTEVVSDALTRLIAVMTRDGKVIGLCGETQLSNENQSITTMMQVYEYYISHHLAKAFESLFGAVTCLPGCFCMYRIRTPRGRPLIISNPVIHDYSENIVDTLHKKNLLHLGEDRYLTTLMLKHFPSYKMKFTPDAQCRTVAPERFEVLLSQRRRWINSTIHNLFELIFLNEMCGFCCFSMRFVVFLDLIGTLILPATVIYLIYVIIAASTGFQYISYISIIIMCSTYILQALIFILKQQWQHIGWMVFYLLGMGLFNFYIPIYSYWHFDDFSWGNTRVVMGEDGMKQVITQEESDAIPFDPNVIPMVKWADHEQGMWELGSQPSQLPPPIHSNQFSHQYNSSSVNQLNLVYPPPLGASFASSNNNNYTCGTFHSQVSRSNTPYNSIPPTLSHLPPPSPYLQNQPSHTQISSKSQLIPQPNSLSDDDLINIIQNLLHNADLMTVTKKNIRQQLANLYPDIDWEAQRDRISSIVDHVLQNEL